MITPSMIYWMTRCDSIRAFFLNNFGIGVVLFLSLVVMLVSFIIGRFAGNGSYEIFSGMSDDEYLKHKATFQKISRRSLYLNLFLLTLVFTFNLVGSFVPTTKEMCAIAVIPRIANSESVQDIGQGIVDLAKDWLKELRPNKGDKEAVKESVKEIATEAAKEASKGALK